MPLADTAVRDGGTLHIFTAAVGTTEPTLAEVQAFDPAVGTFAGWRNLGHTDLENDVETDEEGGDSTVRGSRQNPSLREVVEPVTQFLALNSIQVDNDTLSYYFGDGATTATAGRYATSGSFATHERAVLLIFHDNGVNSGVWYAKASIRRNGAPGMAKAGFRTLPLRITPLKATGQPLQVWIDSAITAALSNEVQTVTITGGPTGGTFPLTFAGEPTSAIPFDATAATVQAALEALPNINAGDVVCTGGPLPTDEVVVTFGGQYAALDVPEMTADDTDLEGGTDPAVAISTTTPGGA